MASRHAILVSSSALFALTLGAAHAEQDAPPAASPQATPPQVAANQTVPATGTPEEVTIFGSRVRAASSAGTKSDSALIDTPQSISVITRDDLDQRGVESLNQALHYSTGISPDTRGGTATRYDQLKIRGFDAEQYLDGMRLIGTSYYATPQIDVSRVDEVDVVRGPASVLYGQSSPGGLVALTSKRPTATAFGDVSLSGDTHNLAQGTFDVGGAVDAGKRVLIRLNGMASRSDGQVSRTENQRDSINPAITLRPDENTTWTILYSWQQDPKSASYGSAPPEGSVLPNPNGRLPVNFYDGDPNFEQFRRTQHAVSSLFEHRFGDNWTFQQNARFLRTEATYRSVYGTGLLPDLRHLQRSTAASDESVNALTVDSHVLGHVTTGPVRHDLLAGVDYQTAREDVRAGFGSNDVAPLDIYHPVYGLAIAMPAFTVNQRVNHNQTGIYAQDQLQLGGWHLVLSGRQDWYDLEQLTVADNSRSRLSQGHATGRAGLLYHFDSGFAPYVAYATSFEPQQAYDRTGKVLGPATGRQTETGVKYQPGVWNALVTAAVYDLSRNNVATRDPSDPSGMGSVAAGQIRSRGLELEGRAQPLPGLDVTASFSTIDNKVTRDNGGMAGTRPYGVPTRTASAWTHYTIQDGPAAGLGFGAGVRYLGHSTNGLNTLTIASATLVDLSADYDLGRLRPDLKGAELSLSATNVADERYVSSCYYGSWCWFGAERTVQGTLRYHW